MNIPPVRSRGIAEAHPAWPARIVRTGTIPERARQQATYLRVFAVSAIGCMIGLALDVLNAGERFERIWILFIVLLLLATVLSARRPEWLPVASMAVYLTVLAYVAFQTLTDPSTLGVVLPGVWAVLTMTATTESLRRGAFVGALALANIAALPVLSTNYGDYPMLHVVVPVFVAILALIVIGALSSALWRDALDELDQAVRRSARLTRELEVAGADLEQRVNDRSADLIARSSELQQRTAELRQSLEHRTQLSRELTELSQRDELTGLYNRRRFVAGLQQRLGRGGPASLVIIDLDYFKRINDGYGHPTGDLVLVEVARALASVADSDDLLARMGGEEFALLLPHLPSADGARVAELCRLRIREIEWAAPLTGVTLTASIGVAGLQPGQIVSWEALMTRADDAMYAAKTAGRDRVVVDDRVGRR